MIIYKFNINIKEYMKMINLQFRTLKNNENVYIVVSESELEAGKMEIVEYMKEYQSWENCYSDIEIRKQDWEIDGKAYYELSMDIPND